MPRVVDVAIIGAGLAGSCLAWAFRQESVSVALIDGDLPHAASRIAAGLITPVTGQRMALSWRWPELWPVAVDFFRRIELQIQQPVFHLRPAIRVFQSAEERVKYDQKKHLLTGLVSDWTDVPMWPLVAPHGGFSMSPAAILDVTAFRNATRVVCQEQYFTARIQSEQDLIAGADSIRIPAVDLSARTVIFCQGFIGGRNPWFPWIEFNPTKGEILTLSIPEFQEDRIIHGGVWLVRMSDGHYRCGATHDRDHLDSTPTATGRREIESKLQAFFQGSYEVVDHQAAIRPIIRVSLPVFGRHPQQPRLAYFNGLGSKGSLTTPYFARQFVTWLLGRGEMEPEMDVARLPGAPA